MLQQDGYHVTAVQLPLTGLADDVAATRQVLEREVGDVILVGHSWGGVVVTEAGSDPKVAGLVYVSALVPDDGESASGLLDRFGSPMDGSKPDPAGLVWLDDPLAFHHVSVFASYAKSFVPGQQILSLPDGSSAPAVPTQGSGYDVGVKSDLMDGRVSATLTAFNLRNNRIVNDLSQTDATGSVVIHSTQSGEQRSRGIEFDATVVASDQWQIYVSYSYMDARITEFSGRDAEILAQDPATLDAAGKVNYKNVSLLHGARLQMSAPHLANVWTRYDLRGALAGGYVGGGVNIVRGQTLLPDGPASERQSYTLVNVLAGYGWTMGEHRMRVELTGKNLSDARYRPSQSTRARPREVLLTLQVTL